MEDFSISLVNSLHGRPNLPFLRLKVNRIPGSLQLPEILKKQKLILTSDPTLRRSTITEEISSLVSAFGLEVSVNLKEEAFFSSASEANKVGEHRFQQKIRFLFSDMSEGHKEICKFFASGKTCRFGKHCRFLHFRHPSVPSETNNSNGAVNSQVRASYLHHSKYSSDNIKEKKNNEAVNRREAFGLAGSYSGVSEGYSLPRNDKGEPSDTGKTSEKSVCRFYLKTGSCRFGRNCRFSHEKNGEDGVDLTRAVLQGEECSTNVATDTIDKEGHFKLQESYTKSHARDATKENIVSNSTKPKHIGQIPPRQPQIRRFGQDLTISNNATDDEKKKIRDKEIHQLIKRYPKATRESSGTADCIQFVFCPSDPDWRYDVNSVELKALFPESYPEKQMEISIIDDDVMPKTLRRYIWKCAREWINERFQKMAADGKAEIMYKPFHKWFDRNLEDIFTAGLKLYQTELMAQAAGIDLAAGSDLRDKFEQLAASDEERCSDPVEAGEESSADTSGDSDDPQDSEEEEEESSGEEEQTKGLSETVRKGTEIKLHSLQLKEHTASLRAKSIFIIIRCGRCKEKLDFHTPADRLNCIECGRCHTQQYVNFRPTIAHQFSNVIGYLDLQDCTAFDLVLPECNFIAGCLQCNKEVKFGNIHPGQPRDSWCHSCHSKMKVSAECVKFLQLQPSATTSDTSGAHMQKPKAIKAVKDPAIVEGKPLPDNGACRHYKKSFRWFRFPCCGKAYPCDLCHDDKESHVLLFANRTICGFCAKEQVFAGDRPCKRCNSYMTRKSSEHWEGGQGCRDKVKMSRGDAKKYSDQSKTVSRKAQNKKPSGAKTMKLRRV